MTKQTTSPRVLEVMDTLNALGNPVIAAHSQRYFKTGPGEYGEGDVFIGIRVPVTRTVVRQFKDLSTPEIVELAQSPVHEHRLCAVLILTGQFTRAKKVQQRAELFEILLMLVSSGHVNNWDLVDSSAPYIGAYLLEMPDYSDLLLALAQSEDLWERRTAVMLTAALIRAGIYQPTLELCELLMTDTHDLIHKATGWMLRVVGDQDIAVLRGFLETYSATMPRTMLRYAIEHLDKPERDHYLKQKSLLA